MNFLPSSSIPEELFTTNYPQILSMQISNILIFPGYANLLYWALAISTALTVWWLLSLVYSWNLRNLKDTNKKIINQGGKTRQSLSTLKHWILSSYKTLNIIFDIWHTITSLFLGSKYTEFLFICRTYILLRNLS